MATRITVPDVSPEEAREQMLKNTAAVQTYANLISSHIGELITLLAEFQEGVMADDNRK